MNVIFPDWPDAPARIGAVSTMRTGGFSQAPYGDGKGGGGLNLGLHVGDDAPTVQANRALLQSLLPAAPAWLEQVHGNVVVDASDAGEVPRADASFATQAGRVCVIQTADCLPVLLTDTAGQVVAAAHAGWRGLAGGVLQNTIAKMRAVTGNDILAWLGPAIGPQQFEVGNEVRQVFLDIDPAAEQAFFASRSADKYLADIYQLARLAMGKLGVDRIAGGDYCTVRQSAQFYSYRRDQKTGRMASLIWIRQD